MPGRNSSIEFREVFFRDPNGSQDVLNRCSFTICPGEKVGLVGLNGSGKSTIVKLRKLFGVLFQDYVRYNFSLRENIALSDISRMDWDEGIAKAAEKSRVFDFAGAWEGGMDENLTRRFDPAGRELSGGQWQRVSLARAFFRNAPVVLLDELSATLDPIAEHEIFEEFSKVSEGRSAVLISHRLSSITLCDRILVLQAGKYSCILSDTVLEEKQIVFLRHIFVPQSPIYNFFCSAFVYLV